MENDPTGMKEQLKTDPLAPRPQVNVSALEVLITNALRKVANTGEPVIHQFGVLDSKGKEQKVALVVTPAVKPKPPAVTLLKE